MKIYIAGKFEDKAAVKIVQSICIAKGHEIAHDWTVNEQADERDGTRGVADQKGVENADALILVGHPKCRGALWEAGYAAGLGIPVVLIDPLKLHSVFSGVMFHASSAEHAVHLCEQLRKDKMPGNAAPQRAKPLHNQIFR